MENIFNPEYLITVGGLTLVLIIIFAETGLFFGFFLPGDSLLFTAGLLCAVDVLSTSIYILLLSVSTASILGNFVGYIFGKRVGIMLFKKEDSFFFKKKHLIMTEKFYAKHGGMALILGRFLPVIRTFVPILAGVIHMDYKRFSMYNVSGGVLWVFSLVLLGYFLGSTFPVIQQYLEYVIIAIIIVSFIPVIRVYFKHKAEN